MSNEDNDHAFNTEALAQALADAMKANSTSIKVNTKTLETVTIDNHKSIKTFLQQYTELTTTNQISDTDHKCRNLALEPIARSIHWEFKGKNLYSGKSHLVYRWSKNTALVLPIGQSKKANLFVDLVIKLAF